MYSLLCFIAITSVFNLGLPDVCILLLVDILIYTRKRKEGITDKYFSPAPIP